MLAAARMLTGILLILVLTAAVPVVPSIVPSAHAQPPDTITIGVTDLATSLDPADAYDFNSWEVLRHLYTGLTRQVPGTLRHEPALALRIVPADSFRTWTFFLRPDAAFSDGTPITAQTLVDSIARVIALDSDAAQAVVPYVSSVEAPAPDRVVFHLVRPIAYFDALAALPPYFPQHPDLLAQPRPLPYPDSLIGNGPYLLDRFAPGREIVLRANPAYRLGPQPLTGQIVLRAYSRSQALREALRSREIDIAWRALLPTDARVLLQTGQDIVGVEVPATRVYYLYMNHTLDPGNDPLVREALTLLIDRQRVVTNVFDGQATALTSFVPALFPEAAADLWPSGPDVPAADALLMDAAYRPRGSARLVPVLVTSQALYGSQIAAVAAEISRGSFYPSDYVEGRVMTEVEADTFLSTLERGEGRLMLFAWTPLVPHPDAFFRPLAHSSGPIASRGGYARAELDALIDEAAALADPAAQGERYRAAAALLRGSSDIIPLWQEHLHLLAWNDISGVQVEPNFFLHYDSLIRS